ncbi:22998_t:CDS:1, partial [Cetraspora pellucida]
AKLEDIRNDALNEGYSEFLYGGFKNTSNSASCGETIYDKDDRPSK